MNRHQSSIQTHLSVFVLKTVCTLQGDDGDDGDETQTFAFWSESIRSILPKYSLSLSVIMSIAQMSPNSKEYLFHFLCETSSS